MNKKKVLILAFDFPPKLSIGAQRPYSWCRYLPEYGITTDVVTVVPNVEEKSFNGLKSPNPNSCEVLRVPIKWNVRDYLLENFGESWLNYFRKFFSLIQMTTPFLSSLLDEKHNMLKVARRRLSSSKYDLIIATGEPFILFKYAQKLSDTYGIPWVADYRDPWSHNLMQYGDTVMRLLGRYFFRPIEKKIVSKATCITTASPSYSKKIEEIFLNKRIQTILNGYYEPLFSKQREKAKKDIFTIIYAGRIYPHQELEVFLEGFRKFSALKEDAKVVFLGVESDSVALKRLRRYALDDKVVTTAWLPHNKVIESIEGASVLLLLSRKNADWLNAKVFDYLRAGNPILLTTDDEGILSSIIEECKAGRAAKNSNEVSSLLEEYYLDWISGELTNTKPINIEQYSRQAQTAKLASLVEQLCAE